MRHTFLYALLFVIIAIHATKHLYNVSYTHSVSNVFMFSFRISQNRTKDSDSLCKSMNSTKKKALVKYTRCFCFTQCAQEAWFTFETDAFVVKKIHHTFFIFMQFFSSGTTQPEHTIPKVCFLAKYHKF